MAFDPLPRVPRPLHDENRLRQFIDKVRLYFDSFFNNFTTTPTAATGITNWYMTYLGWIPFLKVQEVDTNPTVQNVNILQFDQADGFVVSSPVAGTAKVKLTNPGVTVEEVDGAPSLTATTTIQFDQADGFVVSQPSANKAKVKLTAATTLTVKESDGSPSVNPVTMVKLDQAQGFNLTDNTGGTVTISLTNATASLVGVVSTGSQVFAGDKSFTGLTYGTTITATDGGWVVTTTGDATDHSIVEPWAIGNFGTTDSGDGFFIEAIALDGFSVSQRCGGAFDPVANQFIWGFHQGSNSASPTYGIRISGTTYTGATGSFTTTDGKTVTVKGGIIVSIV